VGLQRDLERVAHVEVEVIRRLVEQQQVRLPIHDRRKREARALAAGELAHRLEYPVAAKREASEKVARILLAELRVDREEMLHRRAGKIERIDLVLGEVSD